MAYAQYLTDHLRTGEMSHHALCSYLEFFLKNYDPPCEPADLEKEKEVVLTTAYINPDTGKRNLTTELESWILQQSGNWNVTMAYQIAPFATGKDWVKSKAKIRSLVARFCERGLIEKVPTRGAGWYRRIENDAPKLDPLSAKKDFLDIRYPLGIHDYIYTLPKNVVVVAGSPDAGKTAFMLNLAFMNMNRGMEIRYQSSEMGELELLTRLECFDAPVADWESVDFRERSTDFQDLILPDGINIIDYFEISDSFFQIAGSFKNIYDRLKNGVAFIAVQKSFNADLGRGAEFGLEKPRLYLTLTPNPPEGNIAKIVKAKNRKRSDWNPNGRECVFKLRNGHDFYQCTGWMHRHKQNKQEAGVIF